MIEPNLGNLERVIRLLFGIAFALWAVTRPAMNGVEWFVVAVSIALILNGVFSRCYLWYVWDINTRRKREPRPTSVC
ncbi:MAG: DUF2892 domain-containing protein [Halioglobus sp.]|nr:DUF2892 domain-containing protein [Halioglobus sp.]